MIDYLVNVDVIHTTLINLVLNPACHIHNYLVLYTELTSPVNGGSVLET